jgi:hypothetical protein
VIDEYPQLISKTQQSAFAESVLQLPSHVMRIGQRLRLALIMSLR